MILDRSVHNSKVFYTSTIIKYLSLKNTDARNAPNSSLRSSFLRHGRKESYSSDIFVLCSCSDQPPRCSSSTTTIIRSVSLFCFPRTSCCSRLDIIYDILLENEKEKRKKNCTFPISRLSPKTSKWGPDRDHSVALYLQFPDNLPVSSKMMVQKKKYFRRARSLSTVL